MPHQKRVNLSGVWRFFWGFPEATNTVAAIKLEGLCTFENTLEGVQTGDVLKIDQGIVISRTTVSKSEAVEYLIQQHQPDYRLRQRQPQS